MLNKVFVLSRCKYTIRKSSSLERRRVNTIRYRTEPLSFLGPKISDIVSDYIEPSETMGAFKTKIKNRPI